MRLRFVRSLHLPLVVLLGVAGSGGAQAQSAAIVHIAGPGNMLNPSVTLIDEPLLNGHPEALPMVVPIWNPDRGETGIFLISEIIVQYWEPLERWFIAANPAVIPAGAAFNVWIGRPAAVPAAGALFLHTASADNSEDHVTYLDHPALNGNPNAFFIVTKTTTTNGAMNLHPIGVNYDVGFARWVIYNEDQVVLGGGGIFPRFHVAVSEGRMGFRGASFSIADETCSVPDIVGNSCYLGLVNPRPNGLFQRYWTAFYHLKSLGLWWNTTRSEWAVFTQDQTNMPVGVRLKAIMTDGIFESGFETSDTRGWVSPP